MGRKKTLNKVIKLLKSEEIELDGETMQVILVEVGMDYQMLRQLIMSCDIADLLELTEERLGLMHRAAMVKDDLKVIERHLLSNYGEDTMTKRTEIADELQTHFNNIEIALEYPNNECRDWVRFDSEQELDEKRQDENDRVGAKLDEKLTELQGSYRRGVIHHEDYLLELKEIIKIAENGFDFNE